MLSFFQHFLFGNCYFPLLTIIVLQTANHLEQQQHKFLFQHNETHLKHIFGENHKCNFHKLQLEFELDTAYAIHNILNYIIHKWAAGSKRVTYILRHKTNENYADVEGVDNRIIAKTYKTSTATNSILNILHNPNLHLNNSELLKRQYLASNLDFNFCPQENIDEFINFFKEQSVCIGCNETTTTTTKVWYLILTNIQGLLLPYLERHNFPVPKTYAVCGQTLYQQYVGLTLQHYENAQFNIKLKIAKQLLDAALRFTEGFAGYHIYITDLTSDNLCYNAARDKLYFIDLNSIYIVADAATGRQQQQQQQESNESLCIDYHDHIECDDCFAFVPERLCTNTTNGLSDLNLLAACVYLWRRRRRRWWHEKDDADLVGFLNPIPSAVKVKYPDLLPQLERCVGVSATTTTNQMTSNFDRNERFKAARQLSALFMRIYEKTGEADRQLD